MVTRGRDELKAGILIAVSLVVLAGLIIGVSGVSLWDRYDHYTVRLRSATGLEPGTPVRLGGLKVGKVLSLRIPPEDTARVEITLGVRQGIAIPQGTWATIATMGLLGDPFLQLSTEAHNTQRIPPGSQIPGRDAAQIAELLQRLQKVTESADSFLADAAGILKQDVVDLGRRLNEVAKVTQVTVEHIDAFVAPANRERVEKILANLDQAVRDSSGSVRAVLENLTATSRRMDTTMETVQGLVGENREDLREAVRLLKGDLEGAGSLLTSMERTLQGVDQTLGHVDRTVLDNSDALEETLANLRRSSQNLRELTQSLKERPWSAFFPADLPEKPGMDSRPSKETRK
ncbi:MAG: MlaD family protein [Candidatus Methylomirabilota bacterium]|jgi:virulence factor Mce-like protein